MKQIVSIAADEWRFWRRSHLVMAATGLFACLVILTSVLTTARMVEQGHAREHHQSEADQTFKSQPDRHPHRMVHYGHYVFRAPTPLAQFDPGLDPVTGQSIFLEGHRQNSAMFSESGASADFGGLSWLSPALIYQLIAPLLIILLGHTAISREREAGVLISLLAQGISGRKLLAGKGLALLSFSLVLLLPQWVSGGMALVAGEDGLVVMSLSIAYFFYLSVWCLIALLVSVAFQKSASVLATLSAVWLILTLVMPAVAVNVANHGLPLAGKIESDLRMLADQRKLGDGHNANDPAFQKLRVELLEQYDVDSVEELPINYRGVVASYSEKKLTDLLNRYAEQRMQGESEQTDLLSAMGWLTPTLALAETSRALSGTDLKHYHRFLREAEDLRFDFVQGLNQAHQDSLSYEADIKRNKSDEAWLRARVDSSNWQILDSYHFEPAPAQARLIHAASSTVMLSFWLATMVCAVFWFGGRLKP